MPIQTFNPFPRPVPDSGGGRAGFPDSYSPMTQFQTTTNSSTYVTGFQLSGASGCISTVVISAPTGGSFLRITIDGTVFTDLSGSASQNTSIVQANLMGALPNLQPVAGAPQLFFFTDNFKAEFRSVTPGNQTTMYILYFLNKPGGKKYRTIAVSGNPSVGNDLVNIKGAGFLNGFYSNGLETFSFLLDGSQRFASAQGAITQVLAGSVAGDGMDMIPFTRSLQIARNAGSSPVQSLYTLEVP